MYETEEKLDKLKHFGTPHACWLMRDYVVPGKCLDLAAGEGERTDFFFKGKGDIIATEFSHAALKRLKQRGFKSAYTDLNKFPFPFKNGEFDNVLMFGVLEHIYTPYRAMAEVHRILKKGGRFFIMVPDARNQHVTPDHYYYYSFTGIRLMLQRAGFRRVKRFFNGVLSPGLTRVTNKVPILRRLLPSDLYLVAFKD
jgi:ubiquinone/menaquinone biosynthesis C-methylase UbiE